jgi:processive 1,2-diacylglycerol beta-glucosyltransferase
VTTRVLILTASYGSGHNIAAASVAAAFRRAGAEPTIVDHFRDLVHPSFDRLSRALYYAVLRRAPHLWALAYALGDRMASDSPLALGVTRLGGSGLARLLDDLAPDLVVSVHATPAVVLTELAARGHRVPPHVTVVTDFVAHNQWIARGIDRYCVAADEVAYDFVARGIPPSRVVVTGVPVREAFEQRVDLAAARAAFGLSSNSPVVVAMAGALGSFGRLPELARTLATLPAQGVVVAGHDRRLESAIRRATFGTPVRVFGYVEDIRRLMGAADLLVTKAGGMTLAEAMAAEVPVLSYGSLPGQERRNERFAARSGIALVARSRRELRQALERALAQPALLDDLRSRMRCLRRPDASRRVVAAALELAAARS